MGVCVSVGDAIVFPPTTGSEVEPASGEVFPFPWGSRAGKPLQAERRRVMARTMLRKKKVLFMGPPEGVSGRMVYH
jgi:hypothetical protein